MNSLLRSCIALLLLSSFTGFVSAQDSNLTAATQAAQQWLALVDSGQYGESWQAAAARFKEKVSTQQWLDSMSSARAPSGKLVSREFKSANYETKLPGAPDGKYMVLQYRTKFANAPWMIETVTPMLDKDGQWKVSGYYIRPAD